MVKAPASDKPMQTPQLPGAFDLLTPSWQAFKLNIITFVELLIIPTMFSLLAGLFSSSVGLEVLIRLIGLIVGLILGPALVITQLKSVRGEVIDFSPAVKEGLKYFWRYTGLTFSLVIIIGLGFLLFIIPGVFLLRRYILAPYYLVDQNLSIGQAMRASSEHSQTYSSAIWGLLGVVLLFALLCLILIGFALLIMYYCAPAVRYLQIKDAAKK